MKKSFLLTPFFLGLVYVLSTSHISGEGARGNNRTGATGSYGCYSCHGSTAESGVTVHIELDSAGYPVTRYIGGNSYTIKLSAVNNSTFTLPKFGFQMAAVLLSASGTATAVNTGTFGTMPGGCRNSTVGSIHLGEQSTALACTSGSGAGGGATTYSISIPWTAPAAGTGSIKLFGLVNAVNGDGRASSSDKWNTASDTLTELIPRPISGPTSICVGDTTTLSVVTTGGVWHSTAPSVAAIDSVSGFLTAISVGTATISFSDTAGTATKNVTVLTAPGAVSLAGSTTVCTGATVRLTASSTGGAWRTTDSTIAWVGSTGVVRGTGAGTTVVSYTISNICGSSSASDTILVHQAPNSGVITGRDSVCPGSTLTLMDTATGGTWLTAATSLATVTSTGVVTGVSSGIDYIWYITTNTYCADTAALTLYIDCPLSVNAQVALKNRLACFPNPTSGEVNILFTSPDYEDLNYRVTDLLGRAVATGQTKSNVPYVLSLNQPAGIYFVAVASKSGQYTQSITVSK